MGMSLTLARGWGWGWGGCCCLSAFEGGRRGRSWVFLISFYEGGRGAGMMGEREKLESGIIESWWWCPFFRAFACG